MTTSERDKSDEPVIRARHLRKTYGRVVALADASIDVHAGEVVALVGDNGAGKSTFLSALSGVVVPESGETRFGGSPVAFRNPRDARKAGIETVHQDLALCDNLRIFENVFLGREMGRGPGLSRLLSKRRMRRRAAESLKQLGVEVGDVRLPVTELSGGQRQFVAIARAIAWEARAVLLDEPTAALSVAGAKRILAVIEQLKSHGIAVLLVSHDIPHVVDIADRIVVMRRGQDITNLRASETDATTVVGYMTGALQPQQAA